jgi:hypothetical protein
MFAFLLTLAAAALASAAGFFSIYGLSKIYAASAISIIIMGISLEYAKLITASLLYRYWNKLNFVLKVYLPISVLVLMLITSIGIFGYLTAAYQQDNIPLTQIAQKISTDTVSLQQLVDRKKQLDDQIAKLPSNTVKGRRQLIQTFGSEYKNLQPTIDSLNTELLDLKSKQTTTEANIGPIMYVAKVLNQDPNNSIFYLTIIIVIVFDPLAVALTIATNMVMADNKAKKDALKVIVDAPVIIPAPSSEVPADNIPIILPTTPEITYSKRDEIMEQFRTDISKTP